MTRITTSVGEEVLTGRYPDPAKCSYLYYTCTYCLEEFMLVDPERNFEGALYVIHSIEIQILEKLGQLRIAALKFVKRVRY
jgi:hypothetical protein